MSKAGSRLRFCKCWGAKLDFWWQVEEIETGEENNAGWDLTELTGQGLLRKKTQKLKEEKSSAF